MKIVKKQSLLKNYLFQFSYQGLILIIPFIVSPYLTRTLKDTALGTYTYANSIAYYFIIAANLGIGVHGKRIISQNVGNETRQRKLFWSLLAIHSAISVFIIAVYFLVVLLFVHENTNLFLIEGVYVASALFDITWLFYGLENFSSVVTKNAIIKIIECVLIFAFINVPEDLGKYALIVAGGTLLGQVVMIPQAVVTLKPIKFSFDDVKQHIRPLLVFSVSIVATSLYTVFDKTLLGLMSSIENVAYYEYANKIVNIPKIFVEVISSVMFPKACQFASQNNRDEASRYIDFSFIVTAFLGIGAAFGLSTIANDFVNIYYGKQFETCGSLIIVLSPLIYIIGAGKILRSQYMIPNGMDRQFNICIVYNAIINIIVSASLIPIIGIYGAVAGTILAELFGLIYQMMVCRKFVNYTTMLRTLAAFSVIGVIMSAVIKLSSLILIRSDIVALIAKACIGASVYLVLSLIFIHLFYKDIFSKILKSSRQ